MLKEAHVSLQIIVNQVTNYKIFFIDRMLYSCLFFLKSKNFQIIPIFNFVKTDIQLEFEKLRFWRIYWKKEFELNCSNSRLILHLLYLWIKLIKLFDYPQFYLLQSDAKYQKLREKFRNSHYLLWTYY